jgi:hypothetical protein
MMTDVDIANRAESKLDCMIRGGIQKGIPASRQSYRAVPYAHGFSTYHWDYRRTPNRTIAATYALDLLIIGHRVDNHDMNIVYSMSTALQLPHKLLSDSIDRGFQGYNFDDCEITDRHSNVKLVVLSKRLYAVGANLRTKYRPYFK